MARNSLNKVIEKAKYLINLRHNQFNLDNYRNTLENQLGTKFELMQAPILDCVRKMANLHCGAGFIYKLGKSSKRQIYIVGKGILFDAGGLNIKREMSSMYNDKAGMIIACALSTYLPNINIVCPVTTNFTHTSRLTPGDIVNIGEKKVEITDTDAEGRLIIAEALGTWKHNENDIIITLATLTGAVGYAIDSKATGVFSPNLELVKKYTKASTKANEYAWELPLWDYLEKKHYSKQPIKNYTKDIKAGATEGALFIKQFIKYPQNWLHLDIAYSAFDEKQKANGVPIKSLVNFIESLK
jgi:leucyl aminopeptidase